MTAATNKRLARQWYQGYDAGNPAPAELLANDFTFYLPGIAGPLDGHGARQALALYQAAFAGEGHTIEDEIVEADKVVLRWSWSGTHTSDLMGIPATGKRVTITGIAIFRLADGKIVENRTEFDALGLLQQLGAVPAAAEPTR